MRLQNTVRHILDLENLLFFVAFSAALGIGFVVVPIPLLTLKLGGSVLTLGWLGTLTAFTYVCSCLAGGLIARAIPPKGLAIAGAAVSASAYALLSRADCLDDIFRAAPLSTVGMGTFWVSVQNWLGERGDARSLQRRAAVFSVSWCSGTVIGPWAGGALFDRSPAWPFYCASLAFICSVLMIAITLRRNANSFADEPEATNDRKGADLGRSERLLKVVWTAQFMHWVAFAMTRSIWPKLASDWNFGGSTIGSFFAALALVQTLTFALMGIVHGWRFRRHLLYSGQVVACISVAVMGLASNSNVLYIAFGMFGMVAALVYTSSIYYSLFHTEKRGMRASIHEALVGSGALVGPLYGGLLARIEPWLPFVLMPIVFLAAIFGEELLFRRGNRTS